MRFGRSEQATKKKTRDVPRKINTEDRQDLPKPGRRTEKAEKTNRRGAAAAERCMDGCVRREKGIWRN